MKSRHLHFYTSLSDDQVSESTQMDTICLVDPEQSESDVDETVLQPDSQGYVSVKFHNFMEWVHSTKMFQRHTWKETENLEPLMDETIREREDLMNYVRNKSDDGFIGSYYHVADELKDNEYIQTGYRIGYKTFMPSMKTMCILNNETVNVWSHFLGNFVFWGMIFVFAVVYPYLGQAAQSYDKMTAQKQLDPGFETLTFLKNEFSLFNNYQDLNKIEGYSLVITRYAKEQLGDDSKR